MLVVLDDLTHHARSYRELSLLLRRPPGREAFPGDIFYIHARLLERAGQFADAAGGGSITVLPVVETQAENLSAYIPTNLISITDGQIYLSPRLVRKNQFPAVDLGVSVSRVGGKAQSRAFRSVAGNLRVTLSQFEELEDFARFGTRLDDATRARLTRGAAVRAALRQAERDPIPAVEQLTVLVAAMDGQFDGLSEADSFAGDGALCAAAARGLGRYRRAASRENAPLDDDARAGMIGIGRAGARKRWGGAMAQTLETLARRTTSMQGIRSVVHTMKTLSVINSAPYEQAARAIEAYHDTVLDGLACVSVAIRRRLPRAPERGAAGGGRVRIGSRAVRQLQRGTGRTCRATSAAQREARHGSVRWRANGGCAGGSGA